jgi:hypothetical protein
MKLTQLETQVLEVFYNECVDCTGECTEDQNMSYNNAQDVAQALNLTEQQVGGVFTSLLAKGLIYDTRESARRNSGMDCTNDFVLGNVFRDNELAPEIVEALGI